MKQGSLNYTSNDIIDTLENEIEELKFQLKGKDNEIEVLKCQITYLSQFKPIDDILN